MRTFIAALFLALVMPTAHAIDPAPAFEDPAMQSRYERLSRELRCLVCRSDTIADSTAELAHDLRRQLRELMAAGKSDGEIVQYMTDRYGDYVLYKPRFGGKTLLLWLAPALLVLGGAITVGIVIVRKSRLPSDTDPSDPGLGVS